MNIVLLIAGFILLTKGADYLVNGAAALSRRLKVSEMAIGLTVVAFGTSLPEMVVSILAALNGQSDVSVGNVVGSNIFNIAGILGFSGLLNTLAIQRKTISFEIPLSILAAIILLITANDAFLNHGNRLISRWDALIFLGLFVIFLLYVLKMIRNGKAEPEIPGEEPIGSGLAIIFVIAGLTALVFGGKMVVDNAVSIARLLEIPERIIGLTIVAIGTSLPEFATSIAAARKDKADLAIGNVIGSNIFNIGWVLGISAMIHPIQYNTAFNKDIYILIIVSSLLLLFAIFGKKRRTLEKWEAGLLLGVFIAYNLILAGF